MPLLSRGFRNTFAAVVGVPVKPVTGGAPTPHAEHEFSLVSFDKFGLPLPIPPGLGDLPLYPDTHGFYSVNGSRELTGLSDRTVCAPPPLDEDRFRMDELGVDIAKFSSENRNMACNLPSYNLNHDAISRFATPPPSHSTGNISLTKSSVVSHAQGQSGRVTPAMSLAVPGKPRFRQSRHWTATTK